MLIEKITLSNWLSYPAKWEQNGQLVEPSLRFDQEQVYLIFGKNGAGKSSIMEAILFALFGDYSRTLGRQDIKKNGAIRTGEKTAKVELVFNLNGQRHKVWRILDEKTSKAQYFSWDAINKSWVEGTSQVKQVNDKIVDLLGMNQDLFCGTVILEQGKTGRFMELNPGEQVDHVKNLLGLNIYSLYYEKARELANQRKRDAKTKEDELKKLSGTTIETVRETEMGVGRVQGILDQIEDEIQDLGQLSTKVKMVEELRGELTKVTRMIAEYETRITNKKEIETADQIVRDGKQVEPLLREIQQARKQLADQQKRAEGLQIELITKRGQLLESQNALNDKLQPDYNKSEATLLWTKNSLKTLREKFAEAEKQRDLIKSELEFDLRQTELQTQQHGRQQRLHELPQVEAAYQLWTELNRVAPKLDKIVSSLLESKDGATAVAKLQQSLTEDLEVLAEHRITLSQLKEQSEILGANFGCSQKARRKDS